MLGYDVFHNGNLATVLRIRGSLLGAPIIGIQHLNEDGETYLMKDRPEGFEQIVYVAANEITEAQGVDS